MNFDIFIVKMVPTVNLVFLLFLALVLMWIESQIEENLYILIPFLAFDNWQISSKNKYFF